MNTRLVSLLYPDCVPFPIVGVGKSLILIVYSSVTVNIELRREARVHERGRCDDRSYSGQVSLPGRGTAPMPEQVPMIDSMQMSCNYHPVITLQQGATR